MRFDTEWVMGVIWTFCVAAFTVLVICEICNILDGLPRWLS